MSQQTRVQSVLNDVASNICQTLAAGVPEEGHRVLYVFQGRHADLRGGRGCQPQPGGLPLANRVGPGRHYLPRHRQISDPSVLGQIASHDLVTISC
jgi:hypothetical protein